MSVSFGLMAGMNELDRLHHFNPKVIVIDSYLSPSQAKFVNQRQIDYTPITPERAQGILARK